MNIRLSSRRMVFCSFSHLEVAWFCAIYCTNSSPSGNAMYISNVDGVQRSGYSFFELAFSISFFVFKHGIQFSDLAFFSRAVITPSWKGSRSGLSVCEHGHQVPQSQSRHDVSSHWEVEYNKASVFVQVKHISHVIVAASAVRALMLVSMLKDFFIS